jgi:hypothetical protein
MEHGWTMDGMRWTYSGGSITVGVKTWRMMIYGTSFHCVGTYELL